MEAKKTREGKSKRLDTGTENLINNAILHLWRGIITKNDKDPNENERLSRLNISKAAKDLIFCLLYKEKEKPNRDIIESDIRLLIRKYKTINELEGLLNDNLIEKLIARDPLKTEDNVKDKKFVYMKAKDLIIGVLSLVF